MKTFSAIISILVYTYTLVNANTLVHTLYSIYIYIHIQYIYRLLTTFWDMFISNYVDRI